MTMDGEPQGMLLRRRHVLEWLGIEPWLFASWRKGGILRPVFIGGKRPFYLKDDIKKLMKDAKDERKASNQEN